MTAFAHKLLENSDDFSFFGGTLAADEITDLKSDQIGRIAPLLVAILVNATPVPIISHSYQPMNQSIQVVNKETVHTLDC